MENTYKIEGVAFGGKGICRKEGRVYFLSDGVPGDVYTGEVTRDKKRYADVRIREHLQKSPLRGQAPCPHATQCGGCQWQGVDLTQQLIWKQSFLENALKRLGHFDPLPPIETIPAQPGFGHRSRIRLRLRGGGGKPLEVGYFARASRDFLPITQCLVAEAPIQAFLATLPSFPLTSMISAQMEIAALAEGQVMLSLYPDRQRGREGLLELKKEFLDHPQVACVAIFGEQVGGFYRLETWEGLDYYTTPLQFQQNHRLMNHKLRKKVQELATSISAQRVLDLYCGSGNLSLALCQTAQVVGVESNRLGVRTAQHNLLQNRLPGAYHCSEVSQWLEAHDPQDIDLGIVDPPREGFSKATRWILEAKIEHLILIGCDPNHFANMARKLCEAGYSLEEVSLYDFFPHTYHLEAFGYFRLKRGGVV